MKVGERPRERLIVSEYAGRGRALKRINLQADLVIVGGGLAGTCAAVTAAREGAQVVLVQDRPVLGGNASSEVRLWILGATSHMGNNNRWSRESGVVGEFLEENLYRNPEGNPLIVDTVLLDLVRQEPNITLLLNISVYEVNKDGEDRIASCMGFCSQNATLYHISGQTFMDASGDGVVAFLAGASFRLGAETRDEFGEGMAPNEDYGYLLGHSIYFYSKDTGRPVRYTPPYFASGEIERISKYRPIRLEDFGCRLWWVEYGGRRDTVHDTEEIKWELWRVVYGIWDYIKNSGNFPEAETHTLEWVGTIPGKRESRRFMGPYILKQCDVVEQRSFPDTIAYGGWSLDLHPADGLYSDKPGCNQWHSKGVYEIPLRCYLSLDIGNLLICGRIMSASHVAFGSTRVMATAAYGAQAAAVAAVVAGEKGCRLDDLLSPDTFRDLRTRLQGTGQHIPLVPYKDPANLAQNAVWSVSSEWQLQRVEHDGTWLALNEGTAMLLPMYGGSPPQFKIQFRSSGPTSLRIRLRRSVKPQNFTPEIDLVERVYELHKGENFIAFHPEIELDSPGYVFLPVLHETDYGQPGGESGIRESGWGEFGGGWLGRTRWHLQQRLQRPG